MDLRIKEVMNYDFDILGAYKMDEKEAKKLLKGLEKSTFTGKGKWIPTEYDSYSCGDGYPVWDKWECSGCGHEHNGDEDSLTDFCPDCGAKMEVGYMKNEKE